MHTHFSAGHDGPPARQLWPAGRFSPLHMSIAQLEQEHSSSSEQQQHEIGESRMTWLRSTECASTMAAAAPHPLSHGLSSELILSFLRSRSLPISLYLAISLLSSLALLAYSFSHAPSTTLPSPPTSYSRHDRDLLTLQQTVLRQAMQARSQDVLCLLCSEERRRRDSMSRPSERPSS